MAADEIISDEIDCESAIRSSLSYSQSAQTKPWLPSVESHASRHCNLKDKIAILRPVDQVRDQRPVVAAHDPGANASGEKVKNRLLNVSPLVYQVTSMAIN